MGGAGGLAANGVAAVVSRRAAAATVGNADGIYISTQALGSELAVRESPLRSRSGGGVNTNCTSCVIAADARLSGADPAAVAGPNVGYANRNVLNSVAPFGYQAPTTVSAIEAEMQSLGSGARGTIVIVQKNGIEHAINVVNRGGRVIFIDPQIERIVMLRTDLVVQLGLP
jgi:hypothetical protein